MTQTTHARRTTHKGDKRYLVPDVPPFRFGDNGDGKNDRTHYTPWLVVRYAMGDDGTRSLPGGTVFWESPDVWTVGSLGINQPVPGEDTTVYARVTNLGLQDAVGVFVKFWWADPSLAITEASANLIGITTVNINAGSSVEVPCPTPWVPTVVNSGHECLLAEAFSPVFDPLTAPMDPVDDRHVGQKNEQLVFAPSGGHISLKLAAGNISGFAGAMTLEAQSLRLKASPHLVTARAVESAHVLTPATKALPLSLQMAHGPAFFAGPSAQFARRLLSTTLQDIAGTSMVCSAPAQITRTEHFEPWEMRTVEVTGQVPADAQPGEIFAFRVIQRAGRLITGGYTVHVVVTGH